MGPYLSKPKTNVNGQCEENDFYAYSAAEMQGWRKTQEDAHTVMLNYDDKGTAFFAVFDGHGGDEVSKYCAMNFPDFIRKSTLYQSDKIIEALEDSFLKFDQTLKDPDVILKLKELSNDAIEDEQIDHDETTNLRLEASMPIEDVIHNMKYYIDKPDPDKAGGSSSSDQSNTEAKKMEIDPEKHNGDDDTEKESDEKSENESEKKEKPKPSSNLLAAMQLLKEDTLKAFLNDADFDEDEEDEESSESYESDEEDNSVEEQSSDEDEESDEQIVDDEEDEDDLKTLDHSKWLSSEYIQPGRSSGCTAIVAVVRGKDLYVANVGDSRCVLSREGKAVDMSEDHKPEDSKETERIVNAGGTITSDGRVNGGLNLSRAIGDHMYKTNETISDREQMITALPDVKHIEIDPEKDEFLFLACDGIWNSMSSQSVVSFINKHLKDDVDLRTICEKLFNECLAPNTSGDGSGCDNMTCILVQFKKDPRPILKNIPGTSTSNSYVASSSKNNGIKRHLEEENEMEEIKNGNELDESSNSAEKSLPPEIQASSCKRSKISNEENENEIKEEANGSQSAEQKEKTDLSEPSSSKC